ncbi:MAG: hydrogenase iron-sulfur subunit [Dehalococcoidia bacterium]
MPKAEEKGFEPRIAGFVCNWGAYSALDMAGVNRKKYTPNIQFIRLMCLGRVHAGLILKAFELGADGVMLLGCPSGSCHYEFGVDKARKLIVPVGKMLNVLGLGSRRLHLAQIPADDADLVAREINSFERRIRRLGPSPIKYGNSRIAVPQEA